jgi:hypothetical protein
MIFLGLSRTALLSRSIRRPTLSFRRTKATNDNYSKIIQDLLKDLRKDRPEKIKNENASSQTQSQESAWMSAVIEKTSAGAKENGAQIFSIPGIDKNSLASRISESESSYELKTTIAHFLQEYFGNKVKQHPKPLLLAVSIAACRKFNNSGMAYALLNYIETRSLDQFVNWVNTNTVNELLLLDWEVYGDLGMCWKRVKMMNEFGLLPNSRTHLILSGIVKEATASKTSFYSSSLQSIFLENITKVARRTSHRKNAEIDS